MHFTKNIQFNAHRVSFWRCTLHSNRKSLKIECKMQNHFTLIKLVPKGIHQNGSLSFFGRSTIHCGQNIFHLLSSPSFRAPNPKQRTIMISKISSFCFLRCKTLSKRTNNAFGGCCLNGEGFSLVSYFFYVCLVDRSLASAQRWGYDCRIDRKETSKN